MQPDAPKRRNAREWFTLVGLVLTAVTLSVLAPGILLAVPFALLAIVLPPRRPVVQITGVVLLVLVLSARGTGTFWYFERGWTILLGLWFVVFVNVLPRAGFISRALAAIGASAATSGAFLALGGRFGRLDGEVAQRLKEAAKLSIDSLGQMLKTKDGESVPNMAENMYRVAEMQTMLFPALLALASLAALGAAWWMFRRMAASDEQPLRPLREFRFSDHLVWLLVIGAVLLLIPDQLGATAAANRTGSNLVLFMAALYALRGLAVLVVIAGAPGPLGMVIGAVLFVLLYPIMMAATMIVGLIDTWLDIRAKRPIAPPPGS